MKRQFLIFVLLVGTLILFVSFFEKEIFGDIVMGESSMFIQKNVEPQELFDSSISLIQKNYFDSKLNGQNLKKWKNRYKGQIKTDEDANVAINTVLESLDDPYSKYMGKEMFSEQISSISSKIIGIGVNITSIGGKTYIVNVIEGTPADKEGLKEGDIIMKVDDEDVTGLKTSQVASRVRGEIDTIVKLSLVRNNKNITKRITRKDIKIKNVKSKMDGDIGYIQVISFIGASTYKEFLNALSQTQDSKGLIIDLRGNSGGLLPNAVYMANVFIPKGNIVSIVGRNGYKKHLKAQDIGYNIDKPVILLIDEYSASASEIFSGALKDYHKAILVGTKTYGKGMVQRIIPLPNDTGMNLTIAKYLTPNNTDINKKGIEPDLKIPYKKGKEDLQLKAAKGILNELVR